MKPPYRLHFAPDNASLIIRLALEEMGQPYETVLVNRAVRAQKSPSYLSLNPNGLIPVLETPDGPMFETGAILLWLADKHGKMAPPPDSPDRAGFLKWLFFISNTLHTSMRMMFYPEQYVGEDTAAQSALRHRMQSEIHAHLNKLETLAAHSPDWFAGPRPSVLDIYVACLMRWMALYPKGGTGWFQIAKWPLLQAMMARLEHCNSVLSAIMAEGLGQTPFTAPTYANPPEGSAT